MESTISTRNIKNINLIVRIKYKQEISGILCDKEDDLNLYQRETIQGAFNRYTTKKGIRQINNRPKNFYLIRGEEYRLIDKTKKIMELDLNFGDIIEVVSSETIYTIKKFGTKKKKNLLLIILFILAVIIVLGALGLLLYFFVFKKEKDQPKEKEALHQEELVTKMSYTQDILYRYQSNKRTNMIVSGLNETSEDSNQAIDQYIDFVFILRNKHFEIENNITQKNWFSGYIAILNITINNGTDDMMIFYDNNLNKYINKESHIKYKRNLISDNTSLNNDYTEENDTSCFIKIEFYENGEIKSIYIPNVFIMSNMLFIDNIIKLIIPKITPKLYTNNITDELTKLNFYSSSNETISESEEETEEEKEGNMNEIYLTDNTDISDDLIYEKEDEKLFASDNKENIIQRRLNEYNENESNKVNELSSDEYNDAEDTIEPDNSNTTITVELREINIFQQNQEDDLNNDENATIKNCTNLTLFSYQPLENKEISLKGSELSTTIFSNINEKGILFAVKEIQTAIMNQPNSDDNEDEVKKKEENLRTEIYNSNNQISMDDADSEEKINSGFSFDLSKIIMESINDISLIDSYDNEKLRRELYNYFDEFEYILYNETNNTDNNLRVLEDEEDINENITEQIEYEKLIKNYQNTRIKRLEGNDEYYGMKKFTYQKEFFDYNLLGLVLQGKSVCEIEPSNGIVNNYFTLKMSFFKKKFQLAVQQTNLHIILEKMNKMTYDFISLLYQSNHNLKNNNKKYGDIIVDIEKNVSNLFEKYFDYSGIFTESLDNLYFQVSDFTSKFLGSLIELIDDVHANYSLILLKGINNSYEFINAIREITKNSYIKYIKDMVNILENFYNQTLLFLINIEDEVNKIDIFQIDLLYDIVDLIYDSKIIFKDFNHNLYKAIEKGILNFKYDLKDYIESIIGELLYITDFLLININKNEILRKAISESQRNITTKKLKDFRDIILVIMDLLVNKIYDDYDNEMISSNINGIKYYSENSSERFSNEILKASDETTELIKTKIKYINLYETYSNNINEINYIFKKAGEEFNNDVYNTIIKNISLIFPEFLNKEKSSLVQNKQKLFNITQGLALNINNKIKEIDKDAIDLSSKYIEEKLHYFHYNLYNFKKSFLDESLNKLLNDFVLIVENIMKINYIKLIDENYELVTQYLNEENNFVSSIGGNVFLGSEFINRYNTYLKDSKEFMSLSFSDKFIGILEEYFYKIKNDILNYISTKMKNLDKYNFNEEIIKNNFYLIEKIYKEINNLADNINNFFNEENFMMKIKLTAINIGTDIIKAHDEEKQKGLTDLYDYINKRIGNKVYGTGADFIKLTRKRKKVRFWKHYIAYDYYYCSHRNNVYKINKNLDKIQENISDQLNLLIDNYIDNFETYLSDYVIDSQNLYTRIYNFYQIKMNDNTNIQNIMKQYEIIFDDMTNNINFDLIKLDNFNFEEEYKQCLKKLEKNINDIKEKYFMSVYLKDYENFLEYPDEIIFKIENYKKELEESFKIIRDKIDKIYKKRIFNIFKEIKTYIQDIHEFNFNYVLINLDSFNHNKEYYTIKRNVISEYFENYTNKLNKKLEEITILEDNNENLLFKQNDLNDYSKRIEINYSNFTSEFEDIISKNFTIEKCKIINNYFSDSDLSLDSDLLKNSDMTDLMDCWDEIKKSELNYSKYNFNIVKIRTEIYFSKMLIEKLDRLFDDIDYNDIINSNKISEFDFLLNNKNILNIYNETQYKLKEIQDESKPLLSESFELFINSLKDNYKLENELLPFFEMLQGILRHQNINYTNYINKYNKKVLEEIQNLLDDFEKVLNEQIKLKNNYEIFNIDENSFSVIYQSYYLELGQMFNNYKDIINNLKTNGSFYNALKLIMGKYKQEKANFYKNEFNSYLKQLGYDFEFFDYNYDLGEEIYSFLKNEYLDYEYDLKYKYFLLYENNTDDYTKKMTQEISENENIIKTKFEKIFSEFINNFKQGADNALNYDYYNEYINNRTKCKEYKGKNLIDAIKQDLSENDNSEEEIENIFEKCIFDTNLFEFRNINKEINSDLITDISDSTLLDIENDFNCSEINYKINHYKHGEQFMICETNNYFNTSMIYFKEFLEENRNKINSIMKKINSKIEENYVDGKFLYEYLEQNIKYEKEDFIVENFDIYLENIYEITTYIFDLNDAEYKNFLGNILIKSFEPSYKHLIDKYILNEIIDNATIIINKKIESFIDYINQKFHNEYLYYIFLLNHTDEIGNSTKIALINLFNNSKVKIIESINYTLANEINFYIDIFYRENKDLFRKNFINYYNQDNNEYNINIYKIKSYLGELIYDKNFNKTLDNSSHLFIKKISEEIKISIKDFADNKLLQIQSLLNDFSEKLEDILNTKETINVNEEMLPIYNLIQNFTLIVKNQNNRYNFIISGEPFILMDDFIRKELKPPLLLIKDKYNFIEEQILDLIGEIADNFPDCYSLVRDNFINNRIEEVYNYIEKVNETIIEYKDIINIDIESYINKLSFYALINGLESMPNPCDQAYCLINNTRTNNNRRLNSNTNTINIGYDLNITNNNKFINNSKSKYWKKNKNILFKRKLEEYDSSNPGLSKDDVIEYIEDIKSSILEFYTNYLGHEYKYIKTVVNKYLIKINGTCLNNLKRSFSIKLKKFSTLITEEKMEVLNNKILFQYYQIEPFIHERSLFIQELINNFTDILDNTKEINLLISEHVYEKANLYYDLLTDNIQSKYEIIGFTQLRKLESKYEDMTYYKYALKFGSGIDELNKHLSEVDKYLWSKEKQIISYIKDKFGFNSGTNFNFTKIVKIFKFIKSIKKFFDKDFFNKKYPFEIPLPIFPYLILTISFHIKLGSHLDIYPITEGTIGLCTDLNVRGEIGIGVDVGIYIPKGKAPLQISLSAGINGILASGRVGFRLNFYLVAEKYETDLYFIFNAFTFEFYVRFTLKIKIWRYKDTFEFYIAKYVYTLKTIEKHKKKLHNMKFFNLRTKILLQDKLKNVLKKE